jgi:hypothetical protein
MMRASVRHPSVIIRVDSSCVAARTTRRSKRRPASPAQVNLDGEGDATFFTGIVATMSIVPIALPVVLQLYIRFFGGLDERMIDARRQHLGVRVTDGRCWRTSAVIDLFDPAVFVFCASAASRWLAAARALQKRCDGRIASVSDAENVLICLFVILLLCKFPTGATRDEHGAACCARARRLAPLLGADEVGATRSMRVCRRLVR